MLGLSCEICLFLNALTVECKYNELVGYKPTDHQYGWKHKMEKLFSE
jgi:hypothetical protein